MQLFKTTSMRIMALTVMSLVLLALPHPAQADKKQVIKYLHTCPYSAAEITPEGLGVAPYLWAMDFVFQNHSKLKGKYELKFVGDLFGDPNDCLNAVVSGAGQMTYSAPQFMEQYDPIWKIMMAPGVFDNFEHFLRAMETPIWKKRIEEFSKQKGLTIVKWTASMGDFFCYTNKPVTKYEDLKGQKIRYNGAQAFAQALKDVNATSIALPYTEVVTALQTNMIEGLLNDVSGQSYYNLPIYTKYLIPISWGMAPMCIVVNTKWWESLPEADRKVLMDDVFNRIEIYKSMDAIQDKEIQAWADDPRTEVVKFTPEAEKHFKDSLLKSAREFAKDFPAEYLDAIESVRNK